MLGASHDGQSKRPDGGDTSGMPGNPCRAIPHIPWGPAGSAGAERFRHRFGALAPKGVTTRFGVAHGERPLVDEVFGDLAGAAARAATARARASRAFASVSGTWRARGPALRRRAGDAETAGRVGDPARLPMAAHRGTHPLQWSDDHDTPLAASADDPLATAAGAIPRHRRRGACGRLRTRRRVRTRRSRLLIPVFRCASQRMIDPPMADGGGTVGRRIAGKSPGEPPSAGGNPTARRPRAWTRWPRSAPGHARPVEPWQRPTAGYILEPWYDRGSSGSRRAARRCSACRNGSPNHRPWPRCVRSTSNHRAAVGFGTSGMPST